MFEFVKKLFKPKPTFIILDEIDAAILYYYEELTLKEISRVLEVSESRVSQLHTKAVSRLRANMSKYHLSLPL